ncbi:MAG: hypothetical protein IAE82_10110 [Opitutaceae bacterium]|nr:hypothetical protein [Opitutaceae bacterium]
MKTRFSSYLRGMAGLAACAAALSVASGQAIVIDHTCTRIDTIPAAAVQRARETLHIAYGHTSHGSQITLGMQALAPFMNARKADAFPDGAFAFASGGSGGTLDLRDSPFPGASDLGNPNRTAWATATRSYLAAHPDINVIVWSWCGQVDGTEAEIANYLALMSALERDYPDVRFVYMTGHLDGGGATGNVNVRNEQIRAYCRANDKVLYDFADIESYDPDGQVNFMERRANDNCDYDSDGNGTRDRNWATVWQAAHVEGVDWFDCDAAHSQPLNGNRKAYAAWWLWARLAGWAGSTADTSPPSVPEGLTATSASSRSIALAWSPARDDVGVTAYVVHRDGEPVAMPQTPGWTDTGLIAGRTYRYAVSARDAAGNESVFSAEVAGAATPDPIVPGVSAPATLSASGWFSDLINLEPSGDLTPYEVAVASWSDYALRRRWVRRASGAASIGFSADGDWSFPAGTLWIQQCDLETECGVPASRVRLETRVLLRTEDGAVALSYRWNEAQTDAELVPESGAVMDLIVRDGATDTHRQRTIPARADCLQCHNAAAGHALGFRTRQLNRAGPAGSGIANQIAALAEGGWFATPPPAAASLPAHPRLTDTGASIETRARAWLDVNCAGCHRPGGATARTFDLRAAAPLAQAGLVDGPVVEMMGDPAMRLLAPDHPEHSALAVRVGLVGARQMPASGRSEIDPIGQRLLEAWADRLGQPAAAAESLLANLSTRGVVQGGDSVMIGGFVLTGSIPRRMLLRGVGPELGRFGVGAPLGDPRIELFRGSASLGSNDDWGASPEAAAIRAAASACGAFALTEGGRDAALLVTLDPGAYTVHVRGPAGTDAVAMFEAYDVTETSGSRLANLSTRLRLGVGERAAIPGLIVDGATRRTFLLRAVGPGLAERGVAGTLADPTLTLIEGRTAVASNDDWGRPDGGTTLDHMAREVGAFALTAGSRDAALLVTLDPGAYTVVTGSASGEDGVVLVEVYEIL